MTDAQLDGRLRALAARAPAPETAPAIRIRHRRRLALSIGFAATLAVAATATAGGAVDVVRRAVTGYPGVENPGQPLHGARMECMSPPEAAAFLADHGFTDVVWQVESTRTVLQSTAPQHGYVIPGAIFTNDDGLLHMIVDQRPSASPAGDCGPMAMP